MTTMTAHKVDSTVRAAQSEFALSCG